MPNSLRPRIGLLFSGGIDSAVLLDELLADDWRVTPIYVRSGFVWEDAELRAIRRFLAALSHPRLDRLMELELPLADLYGDHWSISGCDVPDDTTPDEAVYLPGRNPLLLMKPAMWCWQRGIERLALATLSSNPFRDATQDFFSQFERMIHEATGGELEIVRPLEHLSKDRVVELGRHLPLELTFSCLAPVGDAHCGRCNKCAERRLAFDELGLADRTIYAAAPASAR